MTASIRTQSDDIALGAKVISYAAQLIGFIAAMALASACSSAIIAVLVAIIATLVLTLLASVAAFFVTLKMNDQHVAVIGATTHSVMFKLGGLFARKATPSQVAA